MDRRDFLKDMALGSLFLKLAPRLIAQVPGKPDLAFVQGDSPAAITKEAIVLLGGMNRFVAGVP